MRIFVAETSLIILGLLCSAAPPSNAGAPATECTIAGPEDPSVDSDLEGIMLWVDNPSPAQATSNRVRIAPGPSERAEPEVCQTPAGGQTVPSSPKVNKDKPHD